MDISIQLTIIVSPRPDLLEEVQLCWRCGTHVMVLCPPLHVHPFHLSLLSPLSLVYFFLVNNTLCFRSGSYLSSHPSLSWWQSLNSLGPTYSKERRRPAISVGALHRNPGNLEWVRESEQVCFSCGERCIWFCTVWNHSHWSEHCLNLLVSKPVNLSQSVLGSHPLLLAMTKLNHLFSQKDLNSVIMDVSVTPRDQKSWLGFSSRVSLFFLSNFSVSSQVAFVQAHHGLEFATYLLFSRHTCVL